mmetsp:Transcript_17949/g.20371  ORF Transcript_17949/g.20371 Transcript_17949/m.20371 type:complete len:167 (+) Transcript_17949:547-1047(+)
MYPGNQGSHHDFGSLNRNYSMTSGLQVPGLGTLASSGFAMDPSVNSLIDPTASLVREFSTMSSNTNITHAQGTLAASAMNHPQMTTPLTTSNTYDQLVPLNEPVKTEIEAVVPEEGFTEPKERPKLQNIVSTVRRIGWFCLFVVGMRLISVFVWVFSPPWSGLFFF